MLKIKKKNIKQCGNTDTSERQIDYLGISVKSPQLI